MGPNQRSASWQLALLAQVSDPESEDAVAADEPPEGILPKGAGTLNTRTAIRLQLSDWTSPANI